jgi:hypothetical protein
MLRLIGDTNLFLGAFFLILALIIAVCAYLDHGAFQLFRIRKPRRTQNDSTPEA